MWKRRAGDGDGGSKEVESLHRPVSMKDGNEVMLLEKIADTGGAEERSWIIFCLQS